MEDQVVELNIGDNRAAVHYHVSKTEQIVVERIVNLDYGIPIQCTTAQGTEWDRVAADCAALIKNGDLKAAA